MVFLVIDKEERVGVECGCNVESCSWLVVGWDGTNGKTLTNCLYDVGDVHDISDMEDMWLEEHFALGMTFCVQNMHTKCQPVSLSATTPFGFVRKQ